MRAQIDCIGDYTHYIAGAEDAGPRRRGRQLTKAAVQAAMFAADKGQPQKAVQKLTQSNGLDSAKAALAAVTGAVKPQKVSTGIPKERALNCPPLQNLMPCHVSEKKGLIFVQERQ